MYIDRVNAVAYSQLKKFQKLGTESLKKYSKYANMAMHICGIPIWPFQNTFNRPNVIN